MANDMPPPVADLMTTLRKARYPATFTVTPNQYEAVEHYLLALRDERVAEWRAAGSPDEWHQDLSPLYVGKHFGLMLKGVELVVSVAARATLDLR
jgi:hypothetical protein